MAKEKKKEYNFKIPLYAKKKISSIYEEKINIELEMIRINSELELLKKIHNQAIEEKFDYIEANNTINKNNLELALREQDKALDKQVLGLISSQEVTNIIDKCKALSLAQDKLVTAKATEKAKILTNPTIVKLQVALKNLEHENNLKDREIYNEKAKYLDD
jgi:hypothetical protein